MLSVDRRVMVWDLIKKGNLDVALSINKESHMLKIQNSKKELPTAPRFKRTCKDEFDSILYHE